MNAIFHSRITRNLMTRLFAGCCAVEDPVAINVWPLFGPQAGGTRVTVTGSKLIDYQEPMIVFVLPNSDHFLTLSTEQYNRTSKR